MIREALDKAEALGATAIQTNATKGEQRVVALSLEEPNHKATKVLAQHTYYLTSVLGTRERIELTEVRRLLGYRVEKPATYREELMRQAGYDLEWTEGVFIPTLTLEELVFPTPPLRAGPKNTKREL